MNKLFYALVLIGFLTSCGSKNLKNEAENTTSEKKLNSLNKVTSEATVFTDVEVATFRKMINEKRGIVLDVRTPGEVANGTLPKAQKIDFLGGEFDKEVVKLPKDKPVYVYCAVGGRSGKAMVKMKGMGFKAVYNLKGGIGAWKNAGYIVEK